jgi:hypothetical protein
MNTNPQNNVQGSAFTHTVRAEGGAAAVTKIRGGPKVTVTRSAEGVYLQTWGENPGHFMGSVPGLQAVTPADLAGHTVVCGEYDEDAYSMTVNVFDAAGAAHDLAADEWFTTRTEFSTYTPE